MNFRKRAREASEVETGALADILFFLLMFFLMISTLASPDAIKLLLPETAKPMPTPANEVIRLTVDDKLNYYIDDRLVDVANLETELTNEVTTKKAVTLVVRMDRNQTVQELTNIYDLAAKLKLSMVMAAEKKNRMMEGYVIIALKSIAVYVFIVAAIRVFGKKEFAQLSVVDVVFILLISNSVQTAMVGNDTSLSGGLVAALALFAMNYVFKWVTNNSKNISKAIDGEPILLIYDGLVKENGLKEASITIEQLKAVVREHGVEEIEEVNLAIFEVDGNISVLSDNYRNLTKRKRKGHRILGQNTA